MSKCFSRQAEGGSQGPTRPSTTSAEKPPARSAICSASRADRRAAPDTRTFARTLTHLRGKDAGVACSDACAGESLITRTLRTLSETLQHVKARCANGGKGDIFFYEIALVLYLLDPQCGGVKGGVRLHGGACEEEERTFRRILRRQSTPRPAGRTPPSGWPGPSCTEGAKLSAAIGTRSDASTMAGCKASTLIEMACKMTLPSALAGQQLAQMCALLGQGSLQAQVFRLRILVQGHAVRMPEVLPACTPAHR